jgi:hypothetical protein
MASWGRAPLVIARPTHRQAERELSPPPAPIGIDYLKLLAAKRDAELGGRRIDYASLDGDGDGDCEGEDRDINQEGDKR